MIVEKSRKKALFIFKCYGGKYPAVGLLAQSKLKPRGCWCIDLTTVQVSMLDNADYSILAFRVEGNRVYYLDFRNLKPYLTEEAAYYSEKRGKTLWQLYIWSYCIQILRNKNRLAISPNRLTELGDYC